MTSHLPKKVLQTFKLSDSSSLVGMMEGAIISNIGYKRIHHTYIMRVGVHFIVILWIPFCKLAHPIVDRQLMLASYGYVCR